MKKKYPNSEKSNRKNSHSIYKILFWISLVINITAFLFMLFNNTKNRLSSDASYTSQPKNEINKMLDSSLLRLDSIMLVNRQLMREIGRPNMKDTINLSPTEKRMIRLVDSTFLVKDSINKILEYMNDSIAVDGWSKQQLITYRKTGDQLGIIKINMDLNLDRFRLQNLENDRIVLENIIGKFDNRLKNLTNLSNRIKGFSKFLKITVDILSSAAAQGMIVKPLKAIASAENN